MYHSSKTYFDLSKKTIKLAKIPQTNSLAIAIPFSNLTVTIITGKAYLKTLQPVSFKFIFPTAKYSVSVSLYS